MDKIIKIMDFFADVETTKEYNGYFCSVGESLTIVVLGSFCGLRNVSQIHQWASSSRVSDFLTLQRDLNNIGQNESFVVQLL